MENLIVTFLTLIFSLFYFKVARKLNIVDKPNYRSSHTEPIVLGGGVVFVFGLLIYFFSHGFQYPFFVTGTVFIAIVSFIDDLVKLRVNLRWPFQILAIVLIFFQVGLENFPLWTYFPVLILALGFINFFNFMDGINGMSGLSALVVMGAFYYLNLTYNVLDETLIIYLIISLVIFGFYNFRTKALMFAGDVGSISISMILLYIGIELMIKIESPLIIMLYMIYGADSTLTLFYRIFKNEKISEPHRQHIYQKLVDNFGFSHMKVSILYAIFQIILSLVAIYFMLFIEVKYHFVVLFVFSQIITILYFMIFYIDEKRSKFK